MIPNGDMAHSCGESNSKKTAQCRAAAITDSDNSDNSDDSEGNGDNNGDAGRPCPSRPQDPSPRPQRHQNLGRLEEAQSAVQAGLAANPSFTISRFRATVGSDNATFLAQRQRLYEGMRLAGVPEQ